MNATQRHQELMREFDTLMATLNNRTQKTAMKKEKTWGDVGDLAHRIEALQNLVDPE